MRAMSLMRRRKRGLKRSSTKYLDVFEGTFSCGTEGPSGICPEPYFMFQRSLLCDRNHESFIVLETDKCHL